MHGHASQSSSTQRVVVNVKIMLLLRRAYTSMGVGFSNQKNKSFDFRCIVVSCMVDAVQVQSVPLIEYVFRPYPHSRVVFNDNANGFEQGSELGSRSVGKRKNGSGRSVKT